MLSFGGKLQKMFGLETNVRLAWFGLNLHNEFHCVAGVAWSCSCIFDCRIFQKCFSLSYSYILLTYRPLWSAGLSWEERELKMNERNGARSRLETNIYRGLYFGVALCRGIGMHIILVSGFQNQEESRLGTSCDRDIGRLKCMGYTLNLLSVSGRLLENGRMTGWCRFWSRSRG